MMEWVGFIVGTILILLGLFVVFASVYGNYKFKYVMNRMHATAMQDTLGLLSLLLGLVCYKGFDFISLKLIFVVIFFWISSPACSHLIARMEISTSDNLEDEMDVIEIIPDEKEVS